MKKILFLCIVATFSFINSWSQTKALKQVLELKVPRAGGARAASVAWHPVQKKYYAAMAGNPAFCLSIFDAKGLLLSDPEQETMFDVRGLWYNPNTKTLQMNGFKNYGWGEYVLNAKGVPTDIKTLQTGMNQPDSQSTAAFDTKKKLLYFLNEEGSLDAYDYQKGSFTETIELHLGLTKNEDDGSEDNYDVIENYNYTNVVFTGIPGAEFGLLNYVDNQIELYNAKDGYLVRKLSLPEEAPAEEMLCFAYTNGIYWLFDREARIWKGYK